MDGFAEDIAALLREKQEIDSQREGVALAMASYDRWLADAVELLLMIASGREVSHEAPEGQQ